MSGYTDWNASIIEQFRANGGQVGDWGRDLVLVHHVGARTGTQRVTPLMSLRQDTDTWLVAASKAGAPDNPAWFYNLIAHPDIIIETADDGTVPVHARVLTDAERDTAWATFTSSNPGFKDYQDKTTRTILLVQLSRR
ncbi:MAG: nitroreductase/quinone reductase family protein [Nostocoides sp.]